MGNHRQLLGPYPYGHSLTNVFLDVKAGVINFEYFQEYFDQVSLSLETAKACLGHHYSQFQGRGPSGAVKFLKLATLREHSKIPSYREVRNELVDHSQIEGFSLSGPLSMWGGENKLPETPCVFVSHRWQSSDEPDPDGTQLYRILERLNGFTSSSQGQPNPEIYLWIDYSCLPQRLGPHALSPEDHEILQAGLAYIAEIVKSCDLMILDSQDYFERAWCYTELFVWLSKLAEIDGLNRGKPLFDSVLTQQVTGNRASVTPRNDVLPLHNFINANLVFRGYGGTLEDLVEIFDPIHNYVSGAVDSASYNLGAYEAEYVPHLIRFMCNSWYFLQQKQCAIPGDREICLAAILNSLKFTNDLSSGERTRTSLRHSR